MGFLQKLFRSKEAQFRERVLAAASRQYPSVSLQPGDTDLIVRLDGVDFDLQSLFGACSRNELQTEELILQYFSYPVALRERIRLQWPGIAPQLRPQLAPAGFAAKFGVLTFPVTGEIVACITTRDGGFVRTADAQDRGVTAEELYAKAIENLDAEPYEREVTATEGSDRFIGLETHDGFDAARILLPRLREFAVSKLGEPYYAGIPNRNFLILWSRDCSSRFQEYAEEKIETDFAIQPFPLSKSRFEATSAGLKDTRL